MHYPPFTPKRQIAAILLIGCFFTSSAPAGEEADQWVRVHQRATETQSRSFGEEVRDRLSDYGSFQWGQLAPGQIEALRRRGLDVTVERDPFELRLGGQTFDPLQRATAEATRSADPDGDFYLVQFDGPIRKQWLRALRAQGIELVQPLHPFSYIVWAPSMPMAAARNAPHVRFSGLMRTEWKLPPAQRFTQSGKRPTMALASAHFKSDRLQAELSRFGLVHAITPFSRHYSLVHMDADGRDYPSIADIPGILTVQYIRPEAGPRSELINQSIVTDFSTNQDIVPGYMNWVNDTGFNGGGVTVGIVDGGIQESHPDLIDSLVACVGNEGSCTGASDFHGTHVAGAVAGTGASGVTDANGFLRGQGVAPGADLVNQSYGPFLSGEGPGGMAPDGMLSIYKDSAASGALLTNNSWGPTSTPQGYDIPTQQIDFISRDADPDTAGNQPVLAVWSIMNGSGDGGGACSPSSLGSPDEAKNLFAVGSTELIPGSYPGGTVPDPSDPFSISYNSGHGPACDGRRVPHIVAPGCGTDSTSPGDSYSLACGTSMASPVVSGAIAVWAERYIAESGANPSPALTKAVFSAAARNLEGGSNADGAPMGHRPDRFQGYGRLDLDAVMNPGAGVFLHDQKHLFNDTGQHWSAEVFPDNPDDPIRIVLAWTDAPGHGLGGATPAWVNNLDLQVNAAGYTYLGNEMGPDGWSAAGGVADPMNNLEGIFLDSAQHDGVTTIRVMAAELKGDALNPYDPGDPRQDFALACYNCETYTISAQPASLKACIPASGSENHLLSLNLGTIGNYSGNVALNSTDLPVGVSDELSPDTVTVPGTSTWTLTVSNAAAPGASFISINGDDGSLNNSATLALELDSKLETVALESPSHGESVGALPPTFSWSALAGAESYRIQIASDSDFTDIVVETVLAPTSFTPSASFEFSGTYYWRVQGINVCDGGDWSATRDFDTRLFRDRFEQND